MGLSKSPVRLAHFQPMAAPASKPVVAGASSGLIQQVVRHIEQILRTESLESGGRLPSERTVSTDLRVSRNTVTAAYNELEQRGIIRRLRGKGAFVCDPHQDTEAFSWSGKISESANLLDEPILEMLARSCSSGLPHPLSAGTPSLECFPTERYQACVNKVIAKDFQLALSVAPTEGQSRLRASIGRWMNVSANRVMITSGAQEGIDLLARCLIEPGEHAIIESPTYPGAIQCFRAARARLVSWDTAWSLDQLEELLIRYRPKLIFTTPTFQNPTGRSMDLATRNGMLALAAQYRVPVIEDDVYSRTYLNGAPPTKSLCELDRHSQVIYLSTFSKILAPGLRIGWVVAPPYMIKQLSLMKMRANLFTEGLNQLVLSELIDSGDMDRHLQQLRRHHQTLRDAALSVAQRSLVEGVLSYSPPCGGLYLWCKLTQNPDLDSLLCSLEKRGVSVAPGNAFFPETAKGTFIRICYTAVSESRVRRGIEILAETLRTFSGETM